MEIEIEKKSFFVTIGKVYDALKADKPYILTVKEKRQRRSLSANAYFWVLCNKLAEKTRIEKTTIYRTLVREMGGNYHELIAKEIAVKQFCEDWAHQGLGWITDVLDSNLDGYYTILAYYGSSQYDTAQMARLIELTVQECKEQGIETMTPAEIDRLIDLWQPDRKERAA